MKDLKKWDMRMLGLAQFISGWSKDPSTQVGAVVSRPDWTVASLGYNGFPRGVPDLLEFYEDREKKLDLVVHGEMNALLSAREPLHGYTIHVWPPAYGPSCARCAVHIIQAGIKRVVGVRCAPLEDSRWEESCRRAAWLYEEAGVELKMYNQRDLTWLPAYNQQAGP